jgi:hypothetical protein
MDKSGVSPVGSIPLCFFILYITWGMKNNSVGGRSSKTFSQLLDVIIIIKTRTGANVF